MLHLQYLLYGEIILRLKCNSRITGWKYINLIDICYNIYDRDWIRF